MHSTAWLIEIEKASGSVPSIKTFGEIIVDIMDRSTCLVRTGQAKIGR